MKNLMKKLTALIVVCSLVLVMIPQAADAASYSKKITKTITLKPAETMTFELAAKAKGTAKISVKIMNEVQYAEVALYGTDGKSKVISDSLKGATVAVKSKVKKGKNEFFIGSNHHEDLKLKVTITAPKATLKLKKAYVPKEEFVGR